MIQEINDRAKWNQFFLKQPTQSGIFLQSFEWGEFQKAVGRKVWRLGVRDQVSGASFAQAIEMPLPFGKKYWFIPRMIVGTKDLPAQAGQGLGARELIEEIILRAKQARVAFIRVEPLSDVRALIPNPYPLIPTHPVSPTQTLLIDLTKSEDELLAGMHGKTRYNVRLALRKGVSIRTTAPHHKMSDRTFCGGSVEFDNFWTLLQETAKRDGFRAHEREYYEKMLHMCHPERSEGSPTPPKADAPRAQNVGERASARDSSAAPQNDKFFVCLWLAYSNTIPLAAAIVGYFGDTATYLHGASSYEHRVLMGPYALHWHIMQEAKKSGYKFYDFWGTNVADSRQPTAYSSGRKRFAVSRKQDWSGMTRFKMGFGGKVVDYPGTFDLPLNRFWYSIYKVGRRLL